ncbi:hypothetical protein [Pseudomonas syringae]|uniref:hypothetical protein n=1 Tax=Pseudomonas syringae TaxID=317 RepID=UPI001CA8706A|nr:hypothetical protein [Pseudomonas syringae]
MLSEREARRFRLQRGLSIFLLSVAGLFLAESLYVYATCGGPGYPVFKGVVAVGSGSVMFYFSKRW